MTERGFTMIELMVALAILGILAAIAWPNYQEWRERSALDSDFNKLKSALVSSRSRSVQEGLYWGEIAEPFGSETCNRLYYGMEAVPGSDRVNLAYFCNLDEKPDQIVTGSDGEVFYWQKLELEPGVTVSSATTLSNDFIWFDKKGETFGNAGSVTLAIGDRSREITISNNGRIREQ